MKKSFTLSQVASHTTEDSCWVIYNKKVYDITGFIEDHPGGGDIILEHAGTDITLVMKDVLEHVHSDAAYDIFDDYVIGDFDDQPSSTTDISSNDRESLHRRRMQLLEQEEESKTYVREDFMPNETDTVRDIKNNQFLDLRKALIPQLLKANFTKEFYLEQVHKPRHLPHPAIFFGHPLLEPLSKAVWYVVPCIWLPVAAYQLSHSLAFDQHTLSAFSFALGMVIWTLLEYVLHRFLFHLDDYLPDHQIAFTLHFTLHGFHHYLPMDKLRLVMPPTLAGLIIYPLTRLGHLLFPPIMAYSVIAGGLFGYVIYDCMHYYLHHAKVFKYHFREMKKYHMAHHYKNYESGYGITSKLWDYMLNTLLSYSS
ncbi:hypothetical protein BDF14DRAFT_1842392 [Spinellus fusiger]|nr:hypothetical protein BDF14DRAFT_1842392 [Spinellus fusiger]